MIDTVEQKKASDKKQWFGKKTASIKVYLTC